MSDYRYKLSSALSQAGLQAWEMPHSACIGRQQHAADPATLLTLLYWTNQVGGRYARGLMANAPVKVPAHLKSHG